VAGRDERKPTATDHIGVIPQKHQGLYAVGLLVPVGRVRAEQLLRCCGGSQAVPAPTRRGPSRTPEGLPQRLTGP